MSATLNQDDIKLLKSVFATKDDLTTTEKRLDGKLVAMEKRQDTKYATKNDLERFATKDYIEKRFDDLDAALIKYSKDVESRIEKLEDVVGIPATN